MTGLLGSKRFASIIALPVALCAACSPAGGEEQGGGSGGEAPDTSGGAPGTSSGGQAPDASGTGAIGAGGASPSGGAPGAGGSSSETGSGGGSDGPGGQAQTGGTGTGGSSNDDIARIGDFCDSYCAAYTTVPECTSPYDTCPSQCPLIWTDRYETCPEEVVAMVTCAEETPASLEWQCSNGSLVAADESCTSYTQAVSDCLNP